MQLYLIYFGIGLLGMAFQIVLKMQSLKTLATKANVCFKPSQFFSDNWLSITLSLLTIILVLTFVSEVEVHYPAVKGWMRFTFAFIGYGGASILSRIFAVADSRLNQAIDYKTTISDTATGTTGSPTPATKP
jgi:hypothetical protein